jgi:flavorubredoxin
MIAREIRPGVQLIATVHWERRLFDSLIPLPDGTSYNAYLVQGSQATALIDSTDPAKADDLLRPLNSVAKIDYIISQHAEQDHSGLLPQLLERYPMATLLCSRKAEEMLLSHLHIAKERIRVVEDGESLALGDKTLQFIYTPWVHWPETMVTYLPEERCLFSCDFLGSHLATSDVYVTDRGRTYEAAKRYYSEIMMPFRNVIQRNLDKISALPIDLIAPSHGPIYDDPAFILDAYRDWVSPGLKNTVVIPYVSMHGSTELMVRRLANGLVRRGVKVELFDLTVTDIGALAISLVDAATVVVATPTVHLGPHPMALYASQLANMLRPKAKYAAVLASYAWASKAIEQIAGAICNLKVEVLGTVLHKGMPDEASYAELDALANAIADAHAKDPQICG